MIEPLRLRICLLTTAYPDGPDSTRGVFIHELCRRLLARGHVVHVVTPRVFPPSKPRETLSGVEVWRFPFPSQGKVLVAYKSVPVRLMVPWMMNAFRYAVQVVHAADCQILHAHWVVPMGVVARAAAVSTGRPYVLSAHGSDLMIWSRRRVIRPLARWAVRGAHAASACNETMIAEYKRLGADERQLLLIRESGADTNLFHPGEAPEPVRRRHRLGADERVILFVGHLIRSKGLDVLLRAFRHVQQPFPTARLLLVGRGDEEGTLRSLSRRLGVSSRVTWAGAVPHEELPAYFALAETFVLPSWSEGFSHVLMEAAACGVPAVASDIPGNRDLVVDGKTGFLFPPGHASALADRVTRLLRDATLRDSMSTAARRRAEALFRAEDQTSKVEALYRLASAAAPRDLGNDL